MKAACYVIDLDVKTPELAYLTKDDLDLDIKFYNASSIDDLSDNDRKYFETEKQAQNFLNNYLHVLNKLDNKVICKDRSFPSILYKRRYIVLSLLGLKTFTIRNYLKRWKSGQLVNLHDQTYFLTVRITSIEELEDGFYQYNFELP